MIELKDVTKVYKISKNQVKALDQVSLKIESGEFIVIFGPSGSGKSTLMHIIGGLDKPTSGEILVDGQDLGKLSDRDLSLFRNKKVGFVFQDYNLHPIFNSKENAALPLILAKAGDQTIEEKTTTVLNEVGLVERSNHKPKELSGGEQQRVAIARALINDPQIILADEPTGNLDSTTGDQIIQLLLGLNKQRKTTLIIITHNEAIAKMAGRVVRIADGKVVS